MRLTVLDTLKDHDNGRNIDDTINIQTTVSEDSLNDMIQTLIDKQRAINNQKAHAQANKKTFQQCKHYLDGLFSGKDESQMKQLGGLLMLYLQKFQEKASFLGFKRFADYHRHRTPEDITNEYFGLVAHEEMDAIYDLIENFRPAEELKKQLYGTT